MKKSLKIKIFFILTGSIAAIIIFYWLLNSLILEKYYISKKKDVLIQTYDEINTAYNMEQEDMKLIFEKIDRNKNVIINIKTQQEEYVYNSNGKEEFKDFLEVPQGENDKNFDKEFEIIPPEFNIGTHRMKPQELLEKTGKYTIQKSYDMRLGSGYITLNAKLDNGYGLYLRTPLESISDSVEISNQFLVISGIFVTIVSSFLMYFISKSITKPIMELSEIAQDMAAFDFSRKYEIKSSDEIGLLGESINILSEQLEEKISKLKSANIELQCDLEQKEKIDNMRKEFLSNVSHELKTPIALIQGYAEGLKDNVVTDEESKNYYLEVILDETDKMGIMVKKLLTLNQLESGKDILSIRRFDIVEMIKEFISRNKIRMESKQVTIYFNSPEKLYVWADEFMIEEVFTNYMNNAYNHISGENLITIDVIQKGNAARISVNNTGSHIAEDELDKIWGSFYKVDKARTREYGGSGIGLSIVKATMELHKQNYGVYNTENGITFWFELDCGKDI